MARLAKLVFTVCMRACVPHVGLDASRFPVGIVKEVMKSVLKQKLAGTSYNTEVTKEIAEIIRNKLKGALGVGMNAMVPWVTRSPASCAQSSGLQGTSTWCRWLLASKRGKGFGEYDRRLASGRGSSLMCAAWLCSAEWGADASGTATQTTTRQRPS